MNNVTIRDVAKHAGVGVATVSRVLNGNPNVKPTTRDRVLDAIDVLNYVPNVAARQLSGGKTMVIGIVSSFLTLPSFSERLGGIQNALADSGYDLVLYSARTTSDLELKLDTLLRQNRVDGVILMTPPLADELSYIDHDIPILAVDSPHMVGHYPTIVVDDTRGAKLAVHHLIDRGHRSIGFVGDELVSEYGVTGNKFRFDGFCEVLAAHDLPLKSEWCLNGGIGSQSARRHAHAILSLDERPTAIFASTDVNAFDVVNVANEMGLRVPEDLAVVGFDDIPAAHYMKLTTVRQYLYQTGMRSAEIMLDWLRTGNPPHEMVIHRSVDLVIRSTT